jgi:hypothetical protein
MCPWSSREASLIQRQHRTKFGRSDASAREDWTKTSVEDRLKIERSSHVKSRGASCVVGSCERLIVGGQQDQRSLRWFVSNEG